MQVCVKSKADLYDLQSKIALQHAYCMILPHFRELDPVAKVWFDLFIIVSL
jgi:hypothetical protein